jgi:HAE1 family hydrophobic/amphiphilic exporter-1
MTSFAFIAGLLPLVFATGPGKIGNRTIGTAAGGCLLVPFVVYLFLIVLHLGRIAEKYKLVKSEEENPLTEEIDNNEVHK